MDDCYCLRAVTHQRNMNGVPYFSPKGIDDHVLQRQQPAARNNVEYASQREEVRAGVEWAACMFLWSGERAVVIGRKASAPGTGIAESKSPR
jgi:hypothetical protein